MSVPQKDHHAAVGAGFFGDLWSGIKSGAKSIWNNVVKPGARQVVTSGLDAAAAAVPSGFRGISEPLRQAVRDRVGLGVGSAGGCVKPRRSPRRKL
jgi:hypothetical protein